jgi:enoyl-CoA hydratase/carnithine racemase
VTEPLILLEYEGETALLTLNRPEKRNALSRDLLMQLESALEQLNRDEIKVVVVTGAGDVSFCAGADLRDTTPEWRRTYTDFIPWIRATRLIRHHPSVFIAAVNGYALGGGLTLVNTCDLAVAAQSATFGAPEITFGLYSGLGGPSTVRRLQPKHAAELILKGKPVDAQTAYRWGLVNEVVPDDQLLVRARELAAEIAQWNATALDVARNSMRAEETMPWDEALQHGVRNGTLIPAMEESNARWRASR